MLQTLAPKLKLKSTFELEDRHLVADLATDSPSKQGKCEPSPLRPPMGLAV